MKETVSRLIEVLGEKQSCGDRTYCDPCDEWYDEHTSQIRIGDVLEKIAEKLETEENDEFECLEVCLRMWFYCGFTNSLQQIILESGWEDCIKTTQEVFKGDPLIKGVNCEGDVYQRLRSEDARALFEFLISLFLKE